MKLTYIHAKFTHTNLKHTICRILSNAYPCAPQTLINIQNIASPEKIPSRPSPSIPAPTLLQANTVLIFSTRISFASSKTPWILQHFLFSVPKPHWKGIHYYIKHRCPEFDINSASDTKNYNQSYLNRLHLYPFISTWFLSFPGLPTETAISTWSPHLDLQSDPPPPDTHKSKRLSVFEFFFHCLTYWRHIPGLTSTLDFCLLRENCGHSDRISLGRVWTGWDFISSRGSPASS